MIGGPLEIKGGFGWQANLWKTQEGLPSFVDIAVGKNWHVMLSTHSLGTPLVPGIYPDAQRAAFTDPGHPGLDVFGDGRGCNRVAGKFEILESVFVAADEGPPKLKSITAVFEERCDGSVPLHGCVHFEQP